MSTQIEQQTGLPAVADPPRRRGLARVLRRSPQPRTPVVRDHAELDREPALRPLDPPLSPRTGEPRRPALLTLAAVLFALATLFYLFQLVGTFWAIVHDWRSSTLVIRHTHPAEMSFPLAMAALLPILHLAAVAAASAYAGFQAWNGFRYARWVALGAIVLAALTFEVNTPPLLGLVLLVPAALVLFLPALTRYNAQQSTFRYLRANPTGAAPLPQRVSYGPLPRYIDPSR